MDNLNGEEFTGVNVRYERKADISRRLFFYTITSM